MKSKNASIILLLIIICFSFDLKAETRKWYYTFELIHVEKNNVDYNSGIVSIDSTKGYQFPSAYYLDDNLSFVWGLQPNHLNLELKNNSNNSIKIDWNNVAYINSGGNTFRIFHSGVKIVDRNNEQLPTVVTKGSKVSDLIIPCVNVSYNTYFGRWMYCYLFSPNGAEHNTTIKISMPIITNEGTDEYIFTFKVIYHKNKVKTRFNSSDLEEYIQLK